jgi:hypothetical protein
MGVFTSYESVDNTSKNDSLRIAYKNGGTDITGVLSSIKMIDRDTSQHIIFIPSLNLTSYGETLDKAEKMIKSSIDDFFEYFLDLSPKQRETELYNMGWKQNKFKNKVYSKAFVDPNGDLQNFNLAEKKVQRLSLAAH